MTSWADDKAAASCGLLSCVWGSTFGSVMIEVTSTCAPPICAAMSPQKFSAATTRTTPADDGAIDGDVEVHALSANDSTIAAAKQPAAMRMLPSQLVMGSIVNTDPVLP